MANPLGSVIAALSQAGVTAPRHALGAPKFGPSLGKPTAMPSVGSKAKSPAPGVQDMLSRAKRPREKGYKKTSLKIGAGPAKLQDLGAMPPMPSGSSSASPTM